MKADSRSIVVVGDAAVDWLECGTAPVDAPLSAEEPPPPNWQLQEGVRIEVREGGVLLLARFVHAATGAPVVTHDLADAELRSVAPNAVVHSLATVRAFPFDTRKEAAGRVFRISEFKGFCGPDAGIQPLPLHRDENLPAIVVLDDAANGFRDVEAVWPRAIRDGKAEAERPLVVLKMSRPLQKGRLWEGVRARHWERLVLILNAEDLRAEGVELPRGLSWERTARDFLWQLVSNPRLIEMAECRDLIVRFGLEGAIHYRQRAGSEEARLYYDPSLSEGEFADLHPGRMLGLTDAFVAALTARLLTDGPNGAGEGVRDGIRASRRLHRRGFGTDAHRLDYPVAELFRGDDDGDRIADVPIPPPTSADASDPEFWCILHGVGREGPVTPRLSPSPGSRLEEVAFRIVRQGVAAALSEVPLTRFGGLWLVDRAEIEAFRAIRNLMRQYLTLEKPRRPLSLAVFGPPGSGKSYGITQVARSVAADVTPLEFNLSQFESYGDLVGAFHRVRDVVLGGRLPLVFFDEFDTERDRPLGWLKFFLMPMQDGAFRETETVHPIGRAIFVFAGGTRPNFRAFSTPDLGLEPETDRARKAREAFRDAKAPDFLSRLRGHVDLLGPNPARPDEVLYLIRRAVILRSLLERNWPGLIDSRGHARIDEGVLRALLKVPRYLHGIRSMEAILDMSLLVGQEFFSQAALPPVEQLQHHVEADRFARLVRRDVLLGAERERIARTIHERYRRQQEGAKLPDDPAMRPWEELPENLKESNYLQADDIPRKLKAIGCGFAPLADAVAASYEFSSEQIEVLARMEHDRWVGERRRDGWQWGPERDVARKVSPYLVPWDRLPEEVREWDRSAVRAIPDLLTEAGFTIYEV